MPVKRNIAAQIMAISIEVSKYTTRDNNTLKTQI